MLEERKLPVTDENLFITAACGEKGLLFLEGKGTIGVRKNGGAKQSDDEVAGGSAPDGYTVTVNGKTFAVALKNGAATVNGKQYNVQIADGLAGGAPAAAPAEPAATAASAAQEITAPVPGIILRIVAQAGAALKADDDILIMEAMKMEIPIKAPADGTLVSLSVAQGDRVNTGAVLASFG
jgi:pyruvate carboxylase subunit B